MIGVAVAQLVKDISLIHCLKDQPNGFMSKNTNYPILDQNFYMVLESVYGRMFDCQERPKRAVLYSKICVGTANGHHPLVWGAVLSNRFCTFYQLKHFEYVIKTSHPSGSKSSEPKALFLFTRLFLLISNFRTRVRKWLPSLMIHTRLHQILQFTVIWRSSPFSFARILRKTKQIRARPLQIWC